MFQIDHMSRTPIYEQLVEQTEKLILAGVLKPSDKLDSVRALSVELSCNPNTIQKAYTDLCNRGVIYSVPGKGCFVSDDAKKLLGESGREKLDVFCEYVRGFRLAGIKKEELLNEIESIYKEASEDD